MVNLVAFLWSSVRKSHYEKIIPHPVIFSHPDLGRVVSPDDLVDDEDEVQVGDEEQVNEEPVALKVFLNN